MRRWVYNLISVNGQGNKSRDYYDRLMMMTILFSLLPLMFKNPPGYALLLERATTVLFIADYLLRFFTADIFLGKGRWSFIRYPFTFLAVIDLLSILPIIGSFHQGFRVLKVLRLFRTLRVFKIFRYSKNVVILSNVLRNQRESLLLVAGLAFAYLFTSALVMFTIEPNQFTHFLDALYWATITLTTIGYGDVYAQTDLGKLITMFSAFFGIAIVALPAGIITAGYMEEISPSKKE